MGVVIQVSYDELNDKGHIYRIIFISLIPVFKTCLITHGLRTLNKKEIKKWFTFFGENTPKFKQ